MANKRIFYAVQQVGFKPLATDEYTGTNTAHGVQSFGVTTNFNLEQVFQLGEIAIYENIEEIPDVEVTVSKVLDGYPLLYHLATQGTDTTSPSLSGRSNTKTFFASAVFPDTNDSATGVPPSIMECSGMYVSSVGYNFPLDDNMSEDLTLVGNDKIWINDGNIVAVSPSGRAAALTFPGGFDNLDEPIGSAGVNRRQDLIFDISNAGANATLDSNSMVDDPNITVLPADVYGMTSSGTNEKDSDGNFGAHVSNITVSVDLGREQINELGRKAPYHRFVTFPTEVTCEIEVTTASGDMVSATEGGILTTGGACNDLGNLAHRTIRIATCEGTRIYLGLKNKLGSVNFSGGDAGGGNATVSYTFTTFNDFTVMHSGDPHASGIPWWASRASQLFLTEADVS